MPNNENIQDLENEFNNTWATLNSQRIRRRVTAIEQPVVSLEELSNEIEEVKKEQIDPERVFNLYKTFNGIKQAPYKDCVITRRLQYFHKDDKNNVVEDYINKCPLYIYDACQIPILFSINGKPNFKETTFIDRVDISKCIRCYYNDGGFINEFYTLYELIDLNNYKECLFDGNFYHNDIADKMSKKYGRYRKVNAIKKAKSLTINEQYKYGVKSPSFLRTEGKKYSFGVELETICGCLPAYLDKELNYEAVHDGSLRDTEGNVNGGEYVTGILVGDTGFLQLKKLTNELKKRTKVDKKCGMHTHLGLENGKTFNKELIVTLYKLALMIEDQVFKMMPLSRRNNEYCRPLEKFNLKYTEEQFNSIYNFELKINEDYDHIMSFLSSGSYTTDKINKKYDHPLGHKCGYNHRSARYCWLNLIPTVFNTRKNGVYTIEFRNHPGTTSYLKTKYWLLICMSILWYAENYQKEILMSNSTNLYGIIMLAYPKQANKIISYMEKRVLKFKDTDEKISHEVELLDYEEEKIGDNLPINKISIKDL